MTDHNPDPRAARLAAARAKLKQHLRDTAVPIRKTDDDTP